MYLLWVLLVGLVAAQFEEEDKDYMGQRIGELNSYHHQVSGDVFAVDANTLLIKNFVYDGNGKDTFFWAGSSNRPGSKGFIVPDTNGKTNVLDKYYNEEFTLKLPSQKRITDIKWFSVFDISTQNNFGDVYIPQNFQPPGYQSLAKMEGDEYGLNSAQVVVMDSKTLKIPAFTYDGKGGEVFFFAGEGPQPSSRGFIVPDELGYLAPLGSYKEKDVNLQLPGIKTIFTIDWLAVYDKEKQKYLAYIIIPSDLNVPPSLVSVMHHKTGLPNCVMLHKNMQVSWESFPPQLTIQLAGSIQPDEYMAFGLSGEQGKNTMVGGDVALVYIDEFQGHAEDFNLTARTVCHPVLGEEGGACNDERLGGINSNQLHSTSKENGITALTYRTTFNKLGDPGDVKVKEKGLTSVIWAIGKISERAHRIKEPSFHHTYSRMHMQIDFGRSEPYDSCFPFTTDREEVSTPWKIPPVYDPSKRVFQARLGPGGGKRGFSGKTGLPSSNLVWYIEGLMAPEIYLRRKSKYTFQVQGGSNSRSAEDYHPFMITDEPVGGYDRLTDKQKSKVRVLAGVTFTRRGLSQSTTVGPLCKWTHRRGTDRRRDDEFNSFESFRNSLQPPARDCADGSEALLVVTPNVTWPDVVYYHSYTTPYMGWKIHIVDSFRRRPSFGSAPSHAPLLLLITFPLFFFY